MPRTIKDVLNGTIGQFWPQLDSIDPTLDGEPISGVAQRGTDGSFELKGLINDPGQAFTLSARDAQERFDYFLAVTEHGGLLLDGVIQSGSRISIGGNLAATSRHEIDHVVHGLDFEKLNGRQFTSASLQWAGIARWAGLTSIADEVDTDSDGYPRGVTLRIASAEPASIPLGEDMNLDLGSTWTIDGPNDARVVRTPTQFTTCSPSGTGLQELLTPLGWIQDLLGLAYQGFVQASGGTARISEDRGRGSKGELWSRHTMNDRPSVRKPKSMTEFPLFSLADLGGLAGVEAWIKLQEQHPRLIRPIVSPFHVGRLFAEQLLIETGSAIDYWRGTNARTEPWANESFQPLAVGRSLGTPFAEWVGDLDQWASLFWHNYNGLKHYIPGYVFDDRTVRVLALSGATVVTCVALQETAGRDSGICERVLSGHRWDNRGRDIRDLVLQSIP